VQVPYCATVCHDDVEREMVFYHRELRNAAVECILLAYLFQNQIIRNMSMFMELFFHKKIMNIEII
jgi:hypothetical protein